MPHLAGCPVDYLAPDTACPACGQGAPDLPRSTSWDTIDWAQPSYTEGGLHWTSEPVVIWIGENPPDEDGSPPLHSHPIRLTFDGGDQE